MEFTVTVKIDAVSLGTSPAVYLKRFVNPLPSDNTFGAAFGLLTPKYCTCHESGMPSLAYVPKSSLFTFMTVSVRVPENPKKLPCTVAFVSL